MDIYGFPYESPNGVNGIGLLPTAFEDVLALNMGVADRYGALTEAEKEQLIFKYKDAKNEEERRSILSALMPEEDAVRAVCRDDELEDMHGAGTAYAGGNREAAGYCGEEHRQREKNPMD